MNSKCVVCFNSSCSCDVSGRFRTPLPTWGEIEWYRESIVNEINKRLKCEDKLFDQKMTADS